MAEIIPDSYRLLENVIFLKKAQIFSAVETSDLRSVALIVEELSYSAQEEIVRENDVGDSMYIIKKGTVIIRKNTTAGAAPIMLAELGRGDCFGDMAMFDAEVRSATAVAKEECVLLRINRDDLNDVILDCPHIATGMLKVFVKRLRRANATIESLSLSARANAAAGSNRKE